MAYVHSDRLSALDATFLALESPSVHMHVGSVGIFEAGALARADGGLDIERIRALAEPALRENARFRQRLERVPVFGHWVWVDDARFDLDYHLRHTSLPEPGDVRQLKRLAGRIFSQKLDRGRPLWEMWFVEGLAEGRFAVISKVHHCMIDGISGVDLLAGFVKTSAGDGKRSTGARFVPRPAPGPARRFADELAHRATLPLRAAAGGLELVRRPRHTLERIGHALGAVGEALASGFGAASATPLDGEIGPHRRFDWTRMDLAAVKEVKARFGGTVNDVVLAVTAGALRSFLERRGLAVDELNVHALVPVSVRRSQQRGKLGNRVATLRARLPADERDPARRMARVIEETRRLKHSGAVEGSELLETLSDFTATTLFAQFSRLASATRSYNLTVTNVPGPPQTVRLLGARMREVYPLVPLFAREALGIALFSYDGGLFWGFDADWDALPDLHDLVGAVQEEFERLQKLEAPRRR
jgi:WS/DGAT/MGAT family acyltransferase